MTTTVKRGHQVARYTAQDRQEAVIRLKNSNCSHSIDNKLQVMSTARNGHSGRLDSFLRRSVKLGYRDANSPSFDNMCEFADERLFSRIVNNSLHPLYSLLPPQRDQHYELRAVSYTHLTLPTNREV